MQISFQEGLPFLQSFVEKAKLSGAREYKKIKSNEQYEQYLRLTPYTTEQPASSF